MRNALIHISYFSASRYISEALYVIRGILLARLFGPAIFGIWTQIKLALIFLPNTNLGTNEAMMREVPYASGMGDHERSGHIRKSVFGFNLLSSAVVVFAITIIFLSAEKLLYIDIHKSWYSLPVIFFISQIYWFIHIRLQSEKKFTQVSKMIFGLALLSTVLGILFAYFYGIEGFLTALGLSYIILIIYAGGKGPQLMLPQLNATLLKELIKSGFPIVISGGLLILLYNVDKLAIWLFMRKADLGVYAIQSYFTNMIMLVPTSVSMVLYPRMMESIGSNAQPSGLEKYLTKPTLIMSYMACPVMAILFFALHLPLNWLLPKYILAIIPGQILIIAIFFMVISKMPAILLISMNRQKLLLAFTGISVMVGASADYIMIKNGMGIVGVAVGTSLSFVVYSSLTMITSLRLLRMPISKSFAFMSLLITPYAVVLFLIGIVLRFFPERDAGWVSDLLNTGFKCLLVTLIMGLLFYLINQRFCLIEQNTLRNKEINTIKS